MDGAGHCPAGSGVVLSLIRSYGDGGLMKSPGGGSHPQKQHFLQCTGLVFQEIEAPETKRCIGGKGDKS